MEERSVSCSICIGSMPPAHKPMAHCEFSQCSRWWACYATLHYNKLMWIKLMQRMSSLSFEKRRKLVVVILQGLLIITFAPLCPHAINFLPIANCNTSLLILNMKKIKVIFFFFFCSSSSIFQEEMLWGKLIHGFEWDDLFNAIS